MVEMGLHWFLLTFDSVDSEILTFCMSLRLPAVWHWGPVESSCHRSSNGAVCNTGVYGETDHQSSCLGHILGHLLHMEPSRTKASVLNVLKMSNVEKMHQQKSLLYEAAERMNAIPACGWGTQVHLDRMDLPIWTEFSVWGPHITPLPRRFLAVSCFFWLEPPHPKLPELLR